MTNTSDLATKKLSEAVEVARVKYLTADYRTHAPKTEILGVLVSHYFEWDGGQIFDTMIEALHDANFHTEADKFQIIWDASMEATS